MREGRKKKKKEKMKGEQKGDRVCVQKRRPPEWKKKPGMVFKKEVI